MKWFRGITFKIFFILFLSFMIGFVFLIKDKYDDYYHELIYGDDGETEIVQYASYLASKYNSYQEEYQLEQLKKDIKNAPKTTDSIICLLDENGQLLERSGFNEEDDYIYVKSYFQNEAVKNSIPSINHYFIDVSALTKQQKELLNECLETSQEPEFYFDGEIELLDDFYFSSTNVHSTKENYYIVDPSYLHYGKDILGNMIFKYANEAYLMGYFHNGQVKEHIPTDSLSYDEINQAINKTVQQKFVDVYIHELSYDDKRIDVLLGGIDAHDSMKILIENSQYFSHVKMKKVESYDSYMMNAYALKNENTDGYIVCFYDFTRSGTASIAGQLYKDNQEIFIISLLLMTIFSYFISYLMTRRIKQIDQVAMKIAHNDFDSQLDVSGNDELSSLSAHINMMSTNLKRNIEQLQLEIDQVKKMENLRKEFIAHFTHEIKTPLAIINGNVDLLEESLDSKKRKQYASIINKEISLVNDLILQMLDLSKLEAKAITLEKENINLKELSEDIIDDYEQLFKEKRLLIHLSDQDIEIYADKKRIAMVIQNYLSNAIKHAKYQSTIDICITKQRFSVENKGQCIDEYMKEKIWDSFISNDKQGTGLGLAICKNILELHNFSYGVINKQEGVVFYFDWSDVHE